MDDTGLNDWVIPEQQNKLPPQAEVDDWIVPHGDDESRRKQESFKRNSAWTLPGSGQYSTTLPRDDETKFQEWVKQNKVPFDPSPNADYDMRGFWKSSQDHANWDQLKKEGKIPGDIDPTGTKTDPNDNKPHFPDYWKTPYHETFSNESQWADPGKAPKWNDKDQLVTPEGKVIFDDRAQEKPEYLEQPKTIGLPPGKLTRDGQPSRTGRAIRAGIQGYREGFDAVDQPFTPETQEKLDATQRAGGVKGYLAGMASTAGEDILAPFAAGAGLYRGAQAAAIEAGVPRDIVSIPDAFAGSPGALRPPAFEGARPPQIKRSAKVDPIIGHKSPPEAPSLQTAPSTSEGALVSGVSPPRPEAGIWQHQTTESNVPRPGSNPMWFTREGDSFYRGENPVGEDGRPISGAHRAELDFHKPFIESRATPDVWTAIAEQMRRNGVPEDTIRIFMRDKDYEFGAHMEPWLGSALKDLGYDGVIADRSWKSPWAIALNPEKQVRFDGESRAGGRAPTTQPLERPSPTSQTPRHEDIQAHGGPWLSKGTNADGIAIYENANGVRAIMENGVPWTEPTKETAKGLVPKQSGSGKRKPQFEIVEKLPESAKSVNVSVPSSGGESVTDG